MSLADSTAERRVCKGFFAGLTARGFVLACLPLLARSGLVVDIGGGEREREKFAARKGLHMVWGAGQSDHDRKALADCCVLRVCGLPCWWSTSLYSCCKGCCFTWRSASSETRQADLAQPVSTRFASDRRPLACHCPRCRTVDVLLQRHHGKGLLVNDDSTTLAGQSQDERKV